MAIYLTPGVMAGDLLEPATDVDGTLTSHIVAGMYSRHCDKDNLLFVIVAPEGFAAPSDWQEKTEAEINALYPGTFGG